MKYSYLLLFLSIQFSVFAQKNENFNISGGTIHYQTFGKGSPILIINGGPGMSSQGFIPLAEELSKNHQTIIYDQRGTGTSSLNKIDSTTLTMDLMVQDIEQLRKHLGIQKWVVMGHSFGGRLAYYYATKHPENISAMIQSSSGGMDLQLLSSNGITARLTQTQRDSLAYYTQKINNGDTSHATLLKRGEFLAPAYLYNKKYVPIVAERLTQGNSRLNSLVWENLHLINYDTKQALKSFNKPVLILHGAEDVVNIEIAKTANKILPDSKLIILPKSSHYGWLDQKYMYFTAIENFLAKNEI